MPTLLRSVAVLLCLTGVSSCADDEPVAGGDSGTGAVAVTASDSECKLSRAW